MLLLPVSGEVLWTRITFFRHRSSPGFIATSDRCPFAHPRHRSRARPTFFRPRDIVPHPLHARRCDQRARLTTYAKVQIAPPTGCRGEASAGTNFVLAARRKPIAMRGAEGAHRGQPHTCDLSIGEPKRERRLTICVRIKVQAHPSLTRPRDSVTIVREETHEIRQPKDEHREEHDGKQVHRRSR